MSYFTVLFFSDGSAQNQPDLIQPRTSASSSESNRPILHDPLEPNFGAQDHSLDDELLNDDFEDMPSGAVANWQV